MAPLYLGHPNNGAQTVAPSLAERGIDLLRAKPSDLKVIAIPDAVQPGFQSYKAYLPAFMLATFRRERISTQQVAYPIQIDREHYMPFILPPLIIDYARPPSAEVIEQLSNIGFEAVDIQNKRCLTFRSYTVNQLRMISETKPNSLTRTSINTANLESIQVYMLLIKIFSSFFRTHNYPAFSDDLHGIEDQLMDFKFETTKKRKRGVDDVGGEDRSARASTEAQSPDTPMDDVTSAPQATDEITLYHAKPARDSIPWGNASQIPNASGIFCPYVPDLATNDNAMVPYVIQRYFLLCLGNTQSKCVEMYDKVLSAWGVLSKTAAGDVLSHMAKMIDVSLNAQARVFPLFSGKHYNGSLISGGRFKLYTRGVVYRPIAYQQLTDELAQAKLHSGVLKVIADMVGDAEEAPLIVASKSMRELAEVLSQCEMSEETRKNVLRESVHLVFPQRFWGINSNSIMKALALVQDSSVAIPLETPMHAHQLFETNRVASVLSAFGYQAPSFLIPSTPVIKLTTSSPAPKTFVIRTVAHQAAVEDLKQVIETKQITNNPTTLSKKHQDRSLNGNDKTVVWQTLLSLVKAQTVGSNLDASKDPDDVAEAGEQDGGVDLEAF
jgi:hypothetical protein